MPKSNKILIYAALLGLGFVLGAIANDIPYVQLKREVDLSTLISFFSLLAAIFIIPFLINTYFARKDSTNRIILSDMDACLDRLESIAGLYKKLYLKDDALTTNDMKELLSELRRATNCIATLSDELDSHVPLSSFRIDVFGQFNERTYKDLTENTQRGAHINDQNYLTASKSIEETITAIKKYRYLTYSD
jgi:hypothetical protein